MWLYEHRNLWRVAIFMLSLVAIMGPWWYDLIFVPSKYTCTSPVIRLKDDYCGMPVSGVWIFISFASQFIILVVEMIKGATDISDSVHALRNIFLYILLLLILVLPLFSTWLLILRGDRNHQQTFHILAWGFSAGVGVFWVIEISRFHWSWALWGLWLYIGLAVVALVLEILMLGLGRRAENEHQKELLDNGHRIA